MSLEQAFKVNSINVTFPVGKEGTINVRASLIATGHFKEGFNMEVSNRHLYEENESFDVELEGDVITYKKNGNDRPNKGLVVEIYIY